MVAVFIGVDGHYHCVVVAVGEPAPKRGWESWSKDEKQLFFEALTKHGRDFDKYVF